MIQKLRSLMVQARWRTYFRRGGDYTWLHEPRVRRHVNACITGSEDRWPMDWFRDRHAAGFTDGVSLGCGDGVFERDVARKGICTRILALDLLQEALDRARESTRKAELDGIEYRRADLNRVELEADAFDIAFFHQSLHHVEALESCVAEVAKSLRPGGMIYLDEYIGPSRTEWKPELIAPAERLYQELPVSLRRSRRLGFPIDRRDPSEAIRSSQIVAVLERHFEVVERRDYGGNLLSVIHPHLRHDRLSTPGGERAVADLIEAETLLLASGEPSYYAVIVARLKG